MMTKSKLLVAEAVDNLDCTPEERSDVFEHLRDHDIGIVHNPRQAQDIAENMLQGLRDANAEDAAEPKWTRLHHSSEGCKASCCTNLAKWEIQIEAVPGIMFTIKACNKHAGEDIEES